MSFSTAIDGLTQMGYAIGHRLYGDVSAAAFSGPTYYTCTYPAGDLICEEPRQYLFSESSVSIPDTAMEYYPAADLYAVQVHINGPVIKAGFEGCTTTGLANCVPKARTRQFEIYSGLYVDKTTGVAVDNLSVGPELSTLSAVDPSAYDVFIVNQVAADWVSPDGSGNAFGECLFTYAHLPTDVTVTYIGTGLPETYLQWNVEVNVIGYTINPDPPPTTAPFMCLL
jgi:hypothetical protein